MSRNFVFLHGGGQGSWVWHETIEAMLAQAAEPLGELLALDVPGCGHKRSHEIANMSVDDIVASLIADIDAAGILQTTIVGHSQAGTMMPRMIKARPELFERAIYVSCLVPTRDQTALNWRFEMPDDGSALLKAMEGPSRDGYAKMFCNDMPALQREAFLDQLGFDHWPAASYAMTGWHYEHLVSCPGTYVLCLRDASLVPSWQQIFADRLGVDEIVRIDAGHQAMNSKPHGLAEIILATPTTR